MVLFLLIVDLGITHIKFVENGFFVVVLSFRGIVVIVLPIYSSWWVFVLIFNALSPIGAINVLYWCVFFCGVDEF